MFFSAYLGDPANEDRWRQPLQRHAEWLGLSAHRFSRTLADGRTFAFGWVSLRPPDTAALVREDVGALTIIPLDTLTRAEALAQDCPRGFKTNAIRMDVSLASGEVRVAVPFLTVEQFYYAGSGGDWVFGNDLRLMLRWAGLRLSDLAVYFLLHYDYVPPPHTLSETVWRVSPGHVLSLPAGGAPSMTQFFRGCDLADPTGSGEPVERVRQALDSVVSHIGRPAAVHFSGGVDSGLIAARLAALGRRDVRLQNFTAGPGADPFYELASDMAAYLGLPCDRVAWNPADVPELLGRLAREYTFPFTDPTIPPTLALVRDMEQRGYEPAMVATGTGAAHPFATGFALATWRRVYAIPRPLRQLGAAAYRAWFWRGGGVPARVANAFQRSTQFTAVQNAAFSRGTLPGVTYDLSPGMRAAMRDALQEAQDRLVEGLTPEDQVAIIAMLRHAMHMCGARPFDPLRTRGVLTVHVFMEPAVVRAAFSMSWAEKRGDGKAKSLLKTLLAQSVPREWVDRKRQPFLMPFSEAFTLPAVRQMVGDTVLASDNPLMALCRTRGVQMVVGRALAGRPMSAGAQRFVWAVTAISLWLSQLEC